MAGGGSFNDDSFDDEAFDEESFDGGESLSGAFDSGSFDSGSFDGDSFDLTGGGSPSPSVVASGTVVGASEAAIRAGATTLILTLTNAEWVTAGATFNAQRQNIIDGLDSDKAEAGGWNAQIRDNLGVTDVVRTSDTVVTISISATPAYDINAAETITAVVPASAISTGDPLSDSFGVSAVGTGFGTGKKKGKRNHSPRRKKTYVVEIDGTNFFCKSLAEVQYLLNQAQEVADTPEIGKRPKAPRVKVRLTSGRKVQSKAVKKAVRRAENRFNEIYQKRRALLDADKEISRLMHRKISEEAAIAALLL